MKACAEGCAAVWHYVSVPVSWSASCTGAVNLVSVPAWHSSSLCLILVNWTFFTSCLCVFPLCSLVHPKPNYFFSWTTCDCMKLWEKWLSAWKLMLGKASTSCFHDWTHELVWMRVGPQHCPSLHTELVWSPRHWDWSSPSVWDFKLAQVEHRWSTCAPPVLTGSVWRCFHGSVAAPVLKELQECGGIYWHWFAFSNTAVSASLCPTYEAVCCFFHSQDETSDSPSSRLVS